MVYRKKRGYIKYASRKRNRRFYKRGVVRASKRARTNRRVARVSDVVRLIHRGRENKYTMHLVFNNSTVNSDINGGNDVAAIMPLMTIGADQNQRIGDTIQPRGLYLKGTIAINEPANVDNRPINVRMFILRGRIDKSYDVNNLNFYELLRYNIDTIPQVSSSTAFGGGQNDMNLPVNTDLFTVLGDYKFTLLPTNRTNDAAWNSDPMVKNFKRINIRIPVPKTVKYSLGSTTNNWPIDFNPFVAVGYSYPDGSPADIADGRLLLNLTSHLYYEDA